MELLAHIDGLFVHAMALTRSQTDAEDLVQETYLRALAATRRLHENSNLKAWLHTILRNIWLNEVRQRRGYPKFLEIDADENSADLLIETAPDPHAAYVSKFETEQVRQALRQLPEEFREIIVLREFADLPYQEIASLLGCAIGTVMSRLSRARLKLGLLLPDTPTSASDTKARPLSAFPLDRSSTRQSSNETVQRRVFRHNSASET